MTKTKSKRKKTWIELLKDRTAIVVSLAALVVALGTLSGTIVEKGGELVVKVHGVWKSLVKEGVIAQTQCVEISEVDVPKEVNLTAWEDMRVTVKGKYNCKEEFGIYVAFVPRSSGDETRFVMSVPYGRSKACQGNYPVNVPLCWDWSKPIPVKEGKWEWAGPIPTVRFLRNPRPVETISISAQVRSVEDPGRFPYWGKTRVIKVVRDEDGGSQ